ncbi:PQ-loop domain-containing transporter [Microlunatus ginsengisoli]|uniref:PQ-loop repeat-containing protein n=1 Tax=Microlunatus ginsengisoli TaxID=363863 RepID=A0ABP6ZNH4_9ACTN
MFIEALGWAAAVLGAGVALPQVIRLFQTRTTAGLSAPAWQATLGANIAWLVHGFITGHANIWLPNLCYLIITLVILSRLIVERGLSPWATLAPGLALGAVSVGLDVWTGPVVFAIAALVPSAFTQLAQFRALVISTNVQAVSLTFLILNVVNQVLWLSWGTLAGEVSIILCASALGTLMLLNLAWGALRRYGLVRARLAQLSA